MKWWVRIQSLLVVSLPLRWHQPQLCPPRPRCLASKLLSSVQAGLSAQWLPQKLNKFSPIDQIQPLTAQTRASCNERSHWPDHSQVSVLGQSQLASHQDTILSIRTAEKDHVGPQLSQVYKTMLLEFHKILKTHAMNSSCKVILKPQWCLMMQNSLKLSNCCQVIFLRVLCQWWAVSAAVQIHSNGGRSEGNWGSKYVSEIKWFEGFGWKKWWILFLMNASSVVGCQKVIWWKHKFEETKQVL